METLHLPLPLASPTTRDSWWFLCIICSEQQEKESGELHSLPYKQSLSFAAQNQAQEDEGQPSQHSSFCHLHKACGKGRKSKLAVCVVTGSSCVQNMGRADFKELQGCTSSLGSTFSAPQLHSRAVTLQLAVICLPRMPWFTLVSSRCFPPYKTGVSERVTGKNPFRDTLYAHTSVIAGPMELRTKLQAWHTPCRKKGSVGSHSVPAALDKLGWAEQKSPTQHSVQKARLPTMLHS